MTAALLAFVARELEAPVPEEIAATARYLARELHGAAILFYGSILRTGEIDGVLDFYVLTPDRGASAWHRAGTRWLWPDVSFHEIPSATRTLRAKVATLPLGTFEQAAMGAMLDTTIWARFAQPAALVWAQDAAVAARVVAAISSAARTAARFAALIGPDRGSPRDYWLALFRETYRAELRVEAPGRETKIIAANPQRYDALLPIAWTADGVAFERQGSVLAPELPFATCRDLMQAWLIRVRVGKMLNLARLFKAAFTFDGATRYALWKIERHTGVRIPLTPWRERHPVLAAPEVLWRVFRSAPH